jgi:hypothetical protein
MTEIPPELLKKIQSIREMMNPDRNPQQHEAEVAMMKLTQILRSHNLEIAQLDSLLSARDTSDLTDEVVSVTTMEGWRKQLIHILSKYNGCVAVVYDNPDPERITSDGFFLIAGKPHNILVVKELYEWLAKELPKWAYDAWVNAKQQPMPALSSEVSSFRDYLHQEIKLTQERVDWELAWEDPAEWRRSYIAGVIWGWDKKMAQERAASTRNGEVNALVAIQDQEALEYVQDKFKTETTTVRAKSMAHSAYRAGEQRGMNLSTEKQVYDGQAPALEDSIERS